MDHNKKMQLEGQSAGVRNADTPRDVDELRDLYEQAYQYLDLSEEAAVEGELGTLKQQVGDLERTRQSEG